MWYEIPNGKKFSNVKIFRKNIILLNAKFWVLKSILKYLHFYNLVKHLISYKATFISRFLLKYSYFVIFECCSSIYKIN